AVGPAQLAAPADPRVVRASLASFIAATRLVTPDLEVQRKAIFCVYGMLKTKDPATAKMNEFLNGTPETSPFTRSAKVTVNTDISTVLPITENTWEVDWQETTRDRDGSLVGQPIIMRATLEIYIVPPSTDAKQTEIQRNPLGIYACFCVFLLVSAGRASNAAAAECSARRHGYYTGGNGVAHGAAFAGSGAIRTRVSRVNRARQ